MRLWLGAYECRKPLVFGTSYPVFNRDGFQLLRCPLWVISRPFSTAVRMSAFGGKADVNHYGSEGPLLAISGHPAARPKSKIGCMENPLENAFLRPSQAATHRRSVGLYGKQFISVPRRTTLSIGIRPRRFPPTGAEYRTTFDP